MDFPNRHLSVKLDPKLSLQGVHFVGGYGVDLQEQKVFKICFRKENFFKLFNFARPGDMSPPELCSAEPDLKR